MTTPHPLLLLLLLIISFASQAPAQTNNDSLPDSKDLNSSAEIDTTKFMTGDWGGVRDKLVELGITPTAKYYTTVLGNPAGGKTRGVQYAGLLNAYLNFDLDKLLGIGGTRFVVSGSWASGRSLSEEDIGNFFNVSNVFSGDTLRLYQMFLRTDLLEGRVNFAFGRMAVGDKFAYSSLFYNYVSLAFDENPVSIPINNPGFISNPEASWGAWLRGSPVDELYLMAGVYNSNPDLGRDSAHGVDFSFRDGAIIIAEAGYVHNQTKGSGKMPGKYKLGAYYDTGSFTRLGGNSDNSETNEDGNYGFYAIGEQMVYRERAASDQGLTPWAALTFAPKEKINTFPLFVSGGLVYQGLFNARDHDKTAFAVVYGKVSDDLKSKDFELLFELTHILEITSWLNIQPDIQYIVHPGGSGEIPDALVIGVLMAVDI